LKLHLTNGSATFSIGSELFVVGRGELIKMAD